MKKKKNKELKYESVDRVSRWSLCQQVCSLLYKSNIPNELIEKEIKELSKHSNSNIL